MARSPEPIIRPPNPDEKLTLRELEMRKRASMYDAIRHECESQRTLLSNAALNSQRSFLIGLITGASITLAGVLIGMHW